MAAVYQYDPGQITFVFNNTSITGYAEGTFIEVEREADAFTKTVGSDGEVTRTKSQNMSGSFKLTLQQASPANDFLSAMATQDEQQSNAVFSALLKDNNGNTIVRGAKTWIKKKPNTEFGNTASNREWMFETALLDYTVGSNIKF